MLLNLQVLDLLEISGSQMRAARSLSMHQTTVSRSYRELAEQFRQVPPPRPRKVCRWGLSSSLRFLRLACRAHRLEQGKRPTELSRSDTHDYTLVLISLQLTAPTSRPPNTN